MASGSLIPGTQSDRVTLNRQGMGELLKSPAIQAMLRERMANVQAAVPDSELDVVVGRSRARAKVIKGTAREEADTGKLSSALDLAGGDRGTRQQNTKKK